MSPYLRLPFDWKAPLGYSIALMLSATSVFYILYCGVAAVSTFVGLNLITIAIADGIADDVNIMNELNIKSDRNDFEAKLLFCNIINDFSDVKQLSVKLK